MIRFKQMIVVGAAVSVLTQAWAPAARSQEAIVRSEPAPTTAQIRTLLNRAVENQHRNDRAIEEFERFERVVSHRAADNKDTLVNRTDRLIPVGTGTIKLPAEENGVAISKEVYRRELQYAVSALELAIRPNQRYQQDRAKYEKRNRDRKDLVENSVKAFRATWGGRETRGSRTLVKLLLEPDPDYKPANRLAVVFEHVRAVLWVDEEQAQFARLEGDITSDITFGGGIIGKVYRGGHFVMEQSEIAPGVWLPTLYTYDVDGRKFLFSFGVHERTEISRYRQVGPPAKAIELVRAELNTLTSESPAR